MAPRLVRVRSVLIGHRPLNSCIVRQSRVSMGTEFQVILAGSDRDYLEAAANQVLDEVEQLEARLSHYRPDSEICDLNDRAFYGPVLMERSLLDLLARAKELSEKTDGAFDCTAGPLVKCWGFFRGQGRLAEPERVREALERIGSRYLSIDREARTVRFETEGLEVHLGAIGKGYAIDCMVETLRYLRVEAGLLTGGGSTIYALGAPPDGDAWRIGLRDPTDPERRLGVVRLKDRALSTSGDYEQYFEVRGRRYSHILDPRTGFPAQGIRSAAVLTDSATDSDALSTAAFVLGVAGARMLEERFSGLGIVLVPESSADSGSDVVILGDVDMTLGDDSADFQGEEPDEG